ncbi:MAG: TraR/DksA family transcriptional regulator [Tetrasphaera sp.]|jgi:RNA polymerase-binding protein DksA|nr:TraR/DksA family transcriptional regulator [Tetrasphaera sp.]
MSPTRAGRAPSGDQGDAVAAAPRKRAASAKSRTRVPPVKAGEPPWTPEDLAAIRAALDGDIQALRNEIEIAENEVVVLMRHSGDGAGDDQADAGSKTLEREQELSLANNAREMLVQSLRALERLDDGTYGVCENCGNAIGKLRLEAAPRATLCLPCKSKEERR